MINNSAGQSPRARTKYTVKQTPPYKQHRHRYTRTDVRIHNQTERHGDTHTHNGRRISINKHYLMHLIINEPIILHCQGQIIISKRHINRLMRKLFHNLKHRKS